MSREWKIKSILILVFLVVMINAGVQLYNHRHYMEPIVAGPGVTKVAKLSDYCEDLKGTAADTNVFFLEGKEEGGKALLICSTHSNEPVAALTAFIFVENAIIDKGTLIVIPRFNNSGSRTTRAGDGYPLYFEIPTQWGNKKFRMGNRGASPLDQWPDPDVYVHYPEKQLLSYLDIRNTNRTWPGRADGPLMEKVTYAAMQIMREEKVDIAIDLHGAETMFPVTNCIVAPDKSMKIATMASLTGPKTVDLLLDGKDPFLLSLSKKKMLFVPYDESGWPMEKRVGQHCSVPLEVFHQFSKRNPDRAIEVKNVPHYAEVVENGIGYYYHDPAKADKSQIYYE